MSDNPTGYVAIGGGNPVAEAIAKLEAWRAGHEWRFWEVASPLTGDPEMRTWNVVLYQSVDSPEGAWSGEGPTLPAAATAALLAAKEPA